MAAPASTTRLSLLALLVLASIALAPAPTAAQADSPAPLAGYAAPAPAFPASAPLDFEDAGREAAGLPASPGLDVATTAPEVDVAF